VAGLTSAGKRIGVALPGVEVAVSLKPGAELLLQQPHNSQPKVQKAIMSPL